MFVCDEAFGRSYVYRVHPAYLFGSRISCCQTEMNTVDQPVD